MATFRLLIDTCVWLDLAKDFQQQPLLSALEHLVADGKVSLLLPQTVIDEFARNQARIVDESGRSLSGTLRRVKEAVEKLGDPRAKRKVIDQLNEVEFRLPTLGDTTAASVARIQKLFAAADVVAITDAVKLRASQRAIDGRAPFHRQRNSINDAILIEVYAEAIAAKGSGKIRFAFVTHNTKDFSLPNGDDRLPHSHLAEHFSKIRSLYLISLGEALRRASPETVADIIIEETWAEEPRRLADILAAIEEMTMKVWYDRHQSRRSQIEEGKIKLVDKEEFPTKEYPRPIQKDIWAGALKAAKRVEKDFGADNLGPWTDFEWGMLNGKLSALRWVLGDEWDNLDT